MDSIVLRFRDTNRDGTIGAHQRLMRSADYAWWGWWKKDSEPERIRELEEITALLRQRSRNIGLFDRSTLSFYAALASDCVFSTGPIRSPEPPRTPSYYSAEKLPAWFKLESIAQLTKEAFVECFGDPPLGEETFFPVTRGQARDVRAPEQIAVRSPTMLHISDIHFGDEYDFPSQARPAQMPLLDIIARDFRDEPPGMIVVSGDITTRADANVLQNEGLRFLTDLAERLEVPRECFVIVPGNHDIALQNFRPLDYSHEASFHLFAKEFYGRGVAYPELRSFTLPQGGVIEILGINSVRLRQEEEKQFGYVQWQLYDDLLHASVRNEEAYRIAVMHHHLVPAPLEEAIDPQWPEASLSATLDAGAVIEGLQKHGFGMALHGHQHVPAASRIARGNSRTALNDLSGISGLIVLAAGSAGSRRLSNELRNNSYNVIRFNGGTFSAEARHYNKALAPDTLFRVSGPALV